MSMVDYALVARQVDLDELRASLIQHDGRERAAFLTFGVSSIKSDPWSLRSRKVFLLRHWRVIDDERLIDQSSTLVTWNNDDFVRQLKDSDGQQFVVGIAHSHPRGAAQFSSVDDVGEFGLFQLLSNRNGAEAVLISVLVGGDGSIDARCWSGQEGIPSRCEISAIGERLHYTRHVSWNANADVFHRQMLAFGPAFTDILANIKVAVVGCGGTGSAVAMLLPRLGVRQIALIDDDVVEVSNLNRVHGATLAQVRRKTPKVEALQEAIESIGLETEVCVYRTHVGDAAVRDVLKSADIVFGCTDDNVGRVLLNRLAYFYLIPVIDLGLAISLSTSSSSIQGLDGRVTVLMPGATCLLCRGVIDLRLARSEQLRRANPSDYERQKNEAYVIGAGLPNPAVVTFTTEVATMAINELIQRIQGFRGANGATDQRTRLFHRMQDLRQGDRPDPECPVCGSGKNWARGDQQPFLDLVS